MPTSLILDTHLGALEIAGHRLIELAAGAGLDAPVPTCPAWTVHHLVAHQAMVHRWATANVRGDDPEAVMNQTDIRTSIGDLPAYFEDGLASLVAALRDAPEDLEAMTFLKDAPPPREFWARRQAHETTVHMVDALAAELGRMPTSAEADVERAFAIDGLDELLRGFFTRGRSKLFDGTERTVVVAPDDAPDRWILHVAERLTVEPPGSPAPETGATTISGTAAQLYLALWNRGDEVSVSGQEPDLLDRWRAAQQVTWS